MFQWFDNKSIKPCPSNSKCLNICMKHDLSFYCTMPMHSNNIFRFVHELYTNCTHILELIFMYCFVHDQLCTIVHQYRLQWIQLSFICFLQPLLSAIFISSVFSLNFHYVEKRIGIYSILININCYKQFEFGTFNGIV